MKRLFKTIIVIIIFMLFCNVKAYRTGQPSLRTNESYSVIGKINGTVYTYTGQMDNNADLYDYSTDDGYDVYCMEHGRDYCAGCEFTLYDTNIVDRENPTGYACAVIKALADENYSTNTREIVQREFWQLNIESTNCSSEIDFIEKASKHESNRIEPSYGDWVVSELTEDEKSLSIANGSYLLRLDGNSEYYVSDAIYITATDYYNFDVTLPTGGFLTTSSSCKNATSLTSPTNASEIYACIPASSTFNNTILPLRIYGNYNVNASCSREALPGTITYSCQSPTAMAYKYVAAGNYQSLATYRYVYNTFDCDSDIIPAGNDTQRDCSYDYTAQDSTNLTLPLSTLKIHKIDSVTGNAVSGVKFELYRLSGDEEVKVTQNVTGDDINLITDSEGNIEITNLPYGTYKLKEIESAPGYYDTEPFEFEVNNSTVRFSIENKPIKTIISKKDIVSDDELPGAHIVITDELGEIVHEFTSTDEPYEFILGPGKYKLVEDVTPIGYDKLETEFEFEILSNGDVRLISPQEDSSFSSNKNTITIYNSPTRVPVPDTKMSNTVVYVLGSVIILLGLAMIGIIIIKSKSKVNRI